MNSSRTITMITITALIMLLVLSVESAPARQKRWTFNSWRLHGRRTPPSQFNPTTESHPPIVATDVNQQDQLYNLNNDDDGDTYKLLFRLLQFFQAYDHVQKQKDSGSSRF